ncbi:AIG2-like protein [Xylaria sp. FL0933]|nr:AIG2-like protein [Xylaria sp. FL0933]
MSELKPRPLFIYGTLCAQPLLAWVLTGDASNISAVSKLVQPATLYGYARFSLKHKDYPAAIKHEPHSSIKGYLLTLETASQRRKVDNFEGEQYTPERVTVIGADMSTEVEADVYLWAGDMEALTADPWKLEDFENERLQDWLDLFEGMELIGEDEEESTAVRSHR